MYNNRAKRAEHQASKRSAGVGGSFCISFASGSI